MARTFTAADFLDTLNTYGPTIAPRKTTASVIRRFKDAPAEPLRACIVAYTILTLDAGDHIYGGLAGEINDALRAWADPAKRDGLRLGATRLAMLTTNDAVAAGMRTLAACAVAPGNIAPGDREDALAQATNLALAAEGTIEALIAYLAAALAVLRENGVID